MTFDFTIAECLSLQWVQMVSILTASGFKNLESLQDFCNRFPSVSVYLDHDLEKIWVYHKDPENIPKSEEINLLPSDDYHCLSRKVKRKIIAGKQFYNLLTEFSAAVIFNKVYSQFCKELATYLFTKCHLFYNWGVNAFEPVIDHFEIHSKIQKRQEKPFLRRRRIIKYSFINNPEISEKMSANKSEPRYRESSVDLFEEPTYSTKHASSKLVSYKSLVEASKKYEKFYDLIKNSNNSYQEVFSLNRVLYDINQRPVWPRRHVLSKGNIEDLMLFIIKIPVVTNTPIENKLLKEHTNWVTLRELLTKFLKNHESISKNSGYGRILKRHLKSVTTPSDKKLRPIPKSIVCSYMLDILRRVLPMELFGRNSVRKSFFSGLIKVINGNKGENFIWYSLLRLLLLRKSDLIWSSQLGSNYVQNQVILKLFKFIVIHYVFLILRNYFYVTETGSSGLGLRYYGKGDMERACSLCLNQLLRDGHVRRLNGEDWAESTVERNWLNTGKIAEVDLKKKLGTTMNSNTQYKQPTAHVRFLPKSDTSDELRIITTIINKTSKRSKSPSVKKKLEKYFLARLSRRKRHLFFVKLFLDFVVDKIGSGIKPLPCNPKLEAGWKKAIHLKEKFGKLFFVKADISNAFDSVKYNVLTEVLKGAFEKAAEGEKVQLMRIIEWRKISGRIRKVVRFSFGNRPRENSVMINRSVFLRRDKDIRLELKFFEIIKQVAMHQRVEIKGKAFELIKGLAQGSAGRFSSQLCEIYYSWVDGLFFAEFINSKDSIFLRGVDDYLFVTSDEEKCRRFLQLIHRGFDDYNVRFKPHKLKTNLVEDIEEVLYLGLIFNFEDMSVKPNYSKYQQSRFLSTVNMFDRQGNNHFNKRAFLQNRSLRINCLKLHTIVFNGVYNNIKTIRQTIFEACLMQSARVMTLANYLYSGGKKNDLEVYEILLISCCKIKKLVSSSGVSTDEVSWLFFFAALNILHKYSGQYKLLLLIVRFRLQKCEKALVKNEAELLFKFLADDVIDGEYWEKLSGTFKLGKLPLKAS